MIEAVLFDLDGVLVLSEPAHVAAYARLFGERGIPFDADIYRERALGRPRSAVLTAFLGSAEPVVMAQKEQYTVDYVRENTLPAVPGALDFVRSLTLPRAVVTASRTPDLFLDAIGARPLFEVVVDGASVTRPKPDPEGYLHAAGQLGVDPAACLVIEDSPSGVQAAKSAGCTVIGLTTTRSPDALESADHVFDSYAQIDAWMRGGYISTSEENP